ncbi:hypothetical protein QD357_10015 [Rhizobium sp. BR 317]|uniref:hypothetical protein n=1 Tax=Rhizobium sp. BR 317 TaxID=3040015 RepID=UPI0039BF795E
MSYMVDVRPDRNGGRGVENEALRSKKDDDGLTGSGEHDRQKLEGKAARERFLGRDFDAGAHSTVSSSCVKQT